MRQILSHDDYIKEFSDGVIESEKALHHALDSRKFEIELYWKRATYFWLFIASIFVAYFSVLDSSISVEQKNELLLILSCSGVVFSWAWVCVNKGSKKWQENWENHVYLLEDKIIGPLYKTTMMRPKTISFSEFMLGPKPYSVTKLNTILSLFTFVIWLCFLIESLPSFDLKVPIGGRYIIILSATILFFFAIMFWGKSDSYKMKRIQKAKEYNKDFDHYPVASKISIRIVNPGDIKN